MWNANQGGVVGLFFLVTLSRFHAKALKHLITTWFGRKFSKPRRKALIRITLFFALLAIRLHLHFMLWLLKLQKNFPADLLHLGSILIFPFLGKSQAFVWKNSKKFGVVNLGRPHLFTLFRLKRRLSHHFEPLCKKRYSPALLRGASKILLVTRFPVKG